MEELKKKLKEMTAEQIVKEAKAAKEYCLTNNLVTLEELKQIPPQRLMSTLITRAYLHRKKTLRQE